MNEFWDKLYNPKEIGAAILFIIGLISFTIVIRQIFRSHTSYQIKLMAFYIFLVLLQLSFGFYDNFKVTELKGRHHNSQIAGFIFIIFEYVILAHLIKINIRSKIVKKSLFISSIIFVVVAIFNWYFINISPKLFSITSTIEAIPLILACLYFFYEILKKPLTLRLDKESSFWIITGILFLFICILPYYLAYKYFIRIPEMQVIDYVGYAIIMILFTKASFCKEKQLDDNNNSNHIF